MPELPDVAYFRKYFEKNALERKIASVQVKNPRILRDISAAALAGELETSAFISSRQHGKYLFVETDNGKWLIMHFGMTGYLEYFEDPEDDPKYDRLKIGFEGGGFLAYVNQRMLGWIGLTGDPDELLSRRDLGPSVLDRRLDYEQFRKRFFGRKGEIKPALMNQSLVAGIGNVYSDEILFQARIHPRTKVNELSEEQFRTIFEKTKQVLHTAVDRDADTSRFPSEYLLRDRRKGARCPGCGRKLETAKVGGRTAYFCPACQSKQSPG